jgi:hypothetical protein
MTSSVSSIASWGTLALVALAAACGSDAPTTPAPQVSPSIVLNSMTVSPQATVIAAGGSQQLTLSGATLDGTPITTFDTVTYSSSDSTRVKVSPTGLIMAESGPRAVTSGAIRVLASVIRDGVTRTDTSYVSVVAQGGTAPTFSIADPAAATIKVPVNSYKTIYPIVTYNTGTEIDTLPSSAVPIKIYVTPRTSAMVTGINQFYPFTPMGTLTVHASTTIFGTALTDSITYNLGDPTSLFIFVTNSGLQYYQSSTGNISGQYTKGTVLYLQTGGVVNFQNNLFSTPYLFTVTFTEKNGGVVPDSVVGLGGGFATFRATVTFPNPGEYTYTWGGDAVGIMTADQRSSTIIVR